MSQYPEPEFNFNGPISKSKHKEGYADWEEWLAKRLGTPVSRSNDMERVMRGGKNFRFVCLGGLDELKLWKKP